MVYKLFQRHGRPDGAPSEFAATVASLPDEGMGAAEFLSDSLPAPASLPPAVPSDFGGDSVPAGMDSELEQSPTLGFIGRYRIKNALGRGGLGQVHEAWDPLLSRAVAVKTLQFDLDTPSRDELDELIEAEARAAAGLNHPHIVTIYDAGRSEQGIYIAMERLHGRDLRRALANGWRPTPGEAALLVRRVADALAYAHARAVVHCDIKPANIFINTHGKPKLLDFGIARVAHGAARPALDGMVAGSPHYLAPEQLRGAEVDARTDVHALGVVLYEMLTGRKAFHGDTLEQITIAVLTNHPAPAHEVRPGVPPTLSRIASKAMARDPEARFQTAMEMANELRGWIHRNTAQPVAEPLPSAAMSLEGAPGSPRRQQRARQRARQRQMQMAAVASCVLLILGGLALAFHDSLPEPPAAPAPAPAVAVVPAPATAVHAVAAAPAEAAAALTAEPPPAATGNVATEPAAATATKPLPRPRAAPATAARTLAAAAPVPTSAAPAARGTLNLAISPWGQVEVDGRAAGIAPPLAHLSLPEGTHTITVRNADFPPHTATVQVSADQPFTLRHRFGP
ncbi:Serine/threonine protein kinase [Rubrivivax sp. A210]|uniref:serine/threonine-protein kinase n=1 Tax=Rubrivivax sp. A210 TaxID=2772301 RepID=UPI00191A27C9|nr:serine/threonine-protein kinase [Rubrivivax sp. A210]CAD5372093.1 Serine/threonine protein kinase [Rubrivivax sp. A210]